MLVKIEWDAPLDVEDSVPGYRIYDAASGAFIEGAWDHRSAAVSHAAARGWTVVSGAGR